MLALSPSQWLIGLTQLIEFICVDGAIEVEAKEKGSRVERCDQRNRGPVEEGVLPGGGIGVILRYTKHTLINVMVHGLNSLIVRFFGFKPQSSDGKRL